MHLVFYEQKTKDNWPAANIASAYYNKLSSFQNTYIKKIYKNTMISKQELSTDLA